MDISIQPPGLDSYLADRFLDGDARDAVVLRHLVTLAWQGREEARAFAGVLLERPGGWAAPLADHALAVLELGRGDYERALSHAGRAVASETFWWKGAALTDLAEAAVRAGRRDDAMRALAAAAGPPNRSALAVGLRARATAVLSDGADAEASYLLAIATLEPVAPLQAARSRLVYGEWLRRHRRRRDARVQLHAAWRTFDDGGAQAFASRTHRELQATGERVVAEPVRGEPTLRGLTVRELHVARLAATGATNQEVAAQLYISPRTVDYHLRKVFQKLGVTSRRQLARAHPGLVAEILPASA